MRETSRSRPGGALDFIEALDDTEILGASVHVVCELRAGAELARKPVKELEALDTVLSGLLIVYPDDRFAAMYGRLLAATQRSGQAIGTINLLIAAAAVLEDAPIVTRNTRDFSRVPGLRVLQY